MVSSAQEVEGVLLMYSPEKLKSLQARAWEQILIRLGGQQSNVI